jgi:hypothetical protein
VTRVPSDVPRVTFFTKSLKRSWNRIVGVNPLPRGASVGEFRKTRHPRNIEFNKVLKICFSGSRTCDFQESWTCEASGSRTCGFHESWTCEASGSRTCDFQESWTCEASGSRTCYFQESWTGEASGSRTRESLESRTGEVTNFGGRLIRESVGSLVWKSRTGRFTNQ